MSPNVSRASRAQRPAVATPAPRFAASALRFLRGLARHNTRPWFEAHRPEYERDVREPMRELIEEMDTRFARFAPEIVGDPRRSMFRIHRDIRFSRDKSPYKTHAACWFYHKAADRQVGRDGEGGSAGLYFHLQPRESFLGGGIWMPPKGALSKIRDAIAGDPDGFAAVAGEPRVRRRFGGLSDEATLKRMPRGFPEDHPAAPWLRYQSFTMGRLLTDAEATDRGLARKLEQEFTLLLPFVRWLNRALGLPPATRR